MNAVAPVVALALLVLAGCVDDSPSDGRQSSTNGGGGDLPPLPAVHLAGGSYLSFRIPNNIGDEFGFDVVVTSPEGIEQSGGLHFYLDEDAGCISAYVPDEVNPECCDNRVRATGDFYCADAEAVGPYTYAWFSNVTLSGNWTLSIERTRSAGAPDLQGSADHCLHVGFSQPDRPFIAGGTIYETECVVSDRLIVDPYAAVDSAE